MDSKRIADLMNAIREGNLNRVRELTTEGDPIDLNRGYGTDNTTPLIAAVMADNAEIVDHLLSLGADMYQPQSQVEDERFCFLKYRHSALARAVEKANCPGAEVGQVLRDLFRHGTNPRIAYEILLGLGCENRLLARFIIEQGIAAGVAPGFEPSLERGEAMLENLLWAGANPNARVFQLQTPLWEVIADHMRIETAAVLLKYGAAADLGDELGRTPLHGAAEKGRCDLLELVLNARPGVNVNVRDNNGNTPLHFAACDQLGFDASKILLEHGADPNALNLEHWTPLANALLRANRRYTTGLSKIRLLLEAGGNLHMPIGVDSREPLIDRVRRDISGMARPEVEQLLKEFE